MVCLALLREGDEQLKMSIGVGRNRITADGQFHTRQWHFSGDTEYRSVYASIDLGIALERQLYLARKRQHGIQRQVVTAGHGHTCRLTHQARGYIVERARGIVVCQHDGHIFLLQVQDDLRLVRLRQVGVLYARRYQGHLNILRTVQQPRGDDETDDQYHAQDGENRLTDDLTATTVP